MSREVLYNEKELLALISLGDEIAFTKLFHHHYNRIYSIAYKLSHSSVLAEEVVQDVFLKIWVKRKDLDHVQNFSAYLNTIVQNTMFRALRKIAANYKKVIAPKDEPDAWASGPEIQLMEKEYQSILRNGVERLPAQQKQVYQLIREKGLKREEVANLLNLRPDTVKFHLSKAMKNLWNYCQLHLHLFIGAAAAFVLLILLSS